MESQSEMVVLVTDQSPHSGVGVYVSRLYDLLRGNFPEIEVRNLNYFRYPESSVHRPIAGQKYSQSRLGVLHALRQNERSFSHQFGARRELIHLCGASYDLAARVKHPIATVHDFGLTTLESLWGMQPRLLLVEAYSIIEWLRTPRYLRDCNYRVSVSNYTRDRLLEWTGLDSTVIPHWIDRERFHPRSKEDCRTQLGLPLDRRIVLSTTSGRAYKNHDLLRRVLAALPPEYLLVKIGYPVNGPPDRVRNEREVSDDRYPLYLNAADAYVHISLREGFGIPLLESMASGTPVVALANPPAPEVLGEAACFLSPKTKAREIASAICSVVESPEVLARLKAAGLKRLRHFDPIVARQSYTDLYLNAMRS
jgi:glycosyltransferase involved in cell wall biosynthesis